MKAYTVEDIEVLREYCYLTLPEYHYYGLTQLEHDLAKERDIEERTRTMMTAQVDVLVIKGKIRDMKREHDIKREEMQAKIVRHLKNTWSEQKKNGSVETLDWNKSVVEPRKFFPSLSWKWWVVIGAVFVVIGFVILVSWIW